MELHLLPTAVISTTVLATTEALTVMVMVCIHLLWHLPRMDITTIGLPTTGTPLRLILLLLILRHRRMLRTHTATPLGAATTIHTLPMPLTMGGDLIQDLTMSMTGITTMILTTNLD